MGKMNTRVLIKKGAEASIYLADWHGRKAILKKRLPKKYRPSEMDEQIRTYRTVHEPQLMHEAKKAGVPTPVMFLVDRKNAMLVMEFIEGKQVKHLLNDVEMAEKRRLCRRIGELIGRLHMHGIVHGDLTTSNMILDSTERIFLVDFGLGEKTRELEFRGVDLHLMKRALQSTHFRFADDCFDAVMQGYSDVVGGDTMKDVLKKIEEIERRGRYVAERKGEADD